MTVSGAIADAARDTIPVTWAALEDDARYGPAALQRAIDLTKARIFGASVPDTASESALNPVVLDYVGKMVVISIIPAGADFWATQRLQDNSGERVSAVWVDRAEKLWELHKNLVEYTKAAKPEVDDLLGVLGRVSKTRPRIRAAANDNDTFLTPNPTDFPRKGAVPDRTVV
jgi:hypothetical protein